MTITTAETTAAHVATEIRRRQRFVVASHARPDGDAIGSSLAMALALRRLGKEARVVSRDRVPPQMQVFPGVGSIEVVDRIEDPGEAVIILECGDAQRTGIAGIERGYVINIDHHPGNALYGAMNWLDLSAAACGEMVFELIGELGVSLTPEIATHVYIAILTDTGAFHYSNITPRTFDICRQCVEAGVNPPAVARSIFDSNNLARLKLYGAVLHRMQLDPSGRIATVSVDQQLARECWRDLRGYRGARQSPADGQGHRRRRVLQGERSRRLAHQHAIEGRHQRQCRGTRVRRWWPHQRVGLLRAR